MAMRLVISRSLPRGAPAFFGSILVGAVVAGGVTGCGDRAGGPTAPPLVQGPAGGGESQTASIGLDGGSITLGSVATLDIPATALDGPTAITLTAASDMPPA